MRHWSSSGPGAYAGATLPDSLFDCLKRKRRGKSGYRVISERTTVYTRYNRADLRKIAELLPALEAGFRTKGWSSSFGGTRWANGVMAARLCLKAACEFMLDPCEEKWAQVGSQLNLIASAVHNGGKFHNKLVSESQLDLIAKHPGNGLFDSPVPYKILYELEELWEGSTGVRPVRIAKTLLADMASSEPMLEAVAKPLPAAVVQQLTETTKQKQASLPL